MKIYIGYGIFPIVLSFMVLPFYDSFSVQLAIFGVGGILAGLFISKVDDHMFKAFIPLTYSVLLWAVFMVITKGFMGAEPWLFYGLLHISYAPAFLLGSLYGDMRLLFWAPFLFNVCAARNL